MATTFLYKGRSIIGEVESRIIGPHVRHQMDRHQELARFQHWQLALARGQELQFLLHNRAYPADQEVLHLAISLEANVTHCFLTPQGKLAVDKPEACHLWALRGSLPSATPTLEFGRDLMGGETIQVFIFSEEGEAVSVASYTISALHS